MIVFPILFSLFISSFIALRCRAPMETFRVYSNSGDNSGVACVFRAPGGTPKLVISIEGIFRGTEYRVLCYAGEEGDGLDSMRGKAILPASENGISLPGQLDIVINQNPANGSLTLMNALALNSTSSPWGLSMQQLGQIIMEKSNDVSFPGISKLKDCGHGNPIYTNGTGENVKYLCVVRNNEGRAKGYIETGHWKGRYTFTIGIINSLTGSTSMSRCFYSNIKGFSSDVCAANAFRSKDQKDAIIGPDGNLSLGTKKYKLFNSVAILWKDSK